MSRVSIFIILCLCALFGALSCGSAAGARYPSYEHTIAKYAPPGKYKSVRLIDPNLIPSSRYCDCPRIWYYDHWVYYHMGHWMYWHSGFWYYYPTFYWHYYHGYPAAYRRPFRTITSHPRTTHHEDSLRIRSGEIHTRETNTRQIQSRERYEHSTTEKRSSPSAPARTIGKPPARRR